MDLGLKGKAAFVAGASSGLGYAVAAALAREGCRVAVASRSATRIQAAATRLFEEEQADAVPIVCDVTEEDQIVRALEKTHEAFGGLNVLMTNAGGPPPGLIDDFDAEQWRAGLELNLMSTINLCRHALPYLREAAKLDGHARILMLTSIAAKQPIGTLYMSNTARAGVQGFAKTLSEEVGQDGITVNTLMPGFTRTDRLQHLVEDLMHRGGQTADEVEGVWASAAALGRLADPGEFAACAAFLASKQAGFITGIALPIDGGYSKHIL